MKKLSLLVQWLVVLALAGLAAYPFIKGRPLPERRPKTWRGWQGFMVLSYAGIGEGSPEAYPTPERAAEQLVALHAAGYRTITPADALGFLEGRHPLPAKALLLLFEGGRKDSVIFTAKAFQKTGFAGTLAIPTRLLKARGGFFLRRGDLKRIAKMRTWSFAGMGHEAIDEIPAGPAGERGHFLTRRAWSDAGAESAADFRARVAADYARSREVLAPFAGAEPLAYVYPFADAGHGAEADPDAWTLNRDEVEKNFRLAFVHAHHPFNGPGADPYELNRWRVPGNLSGAELVWQLEQYAPRADAAGDLREVGAWQFDGGVRYSEAAVEFDPGAPAWARGSDNWADVEVEATLRLAADAVASVYVRHASPKSFLRVTLAADGLRVQENLRGRLRTLHWQPEPIAPGEPVAVRLRVKGPRAWLWRGAEAVAGPLPLAERRRTGRVGLGADGGGFQVEAFRAAQIAAVYAVAADLESVPADEQAHTLAVIAPLAAPADGTAPPLPHAWLAAAAQGTEIVPLLADAAAWDGLETWLRQPAARGLIARAAVPAPTPEQLRRLRELELGAIALVPAENVLAGAFDAALLGPNDWVLVDGSPEETLVALDRLLAVHPAHRTLGYLDPAQCAEWGIARAVRSGS
ncbi:MAG: hypothetical protein AB7V22_01890 [Kiritimatiellia bacterium]